MTRENDRPSEPGLGKCCTAAEPEKEPARGIQEIPTIRRVRHIATIEIDAGPEIWGNLLIAPTGEKASEIRTSDSLASEIDCAGTSMRLEEGAPELLAVSDQRIQSVSETYLSALDRDGMNHVERRPERIVPANEGRGNDGKIVDVINM
jgi:hypothetical protein